MCEARPDSSNNPENSTLLCDEQGGLKIYMVYLDIEYLPPTLFWMMVAVSKLLDKVQPAPHLLVMTF
jgi:hypothetical protein